MSRRARRERPATPEEQRQVEQFAALAADALDDTATPADRRAAYGRMRRLADRIRDPGSLAGLTAAELHDALAEQCPEDHIRRFHPEGAA